MAKKKKEEAPKAVPAGKPSSLVDTRVIYCGDNPWLRLPKGADFVLPEDKDLVDAFNLTAENRLKLHLELLPEPFLGRADAPVVLLNLNPGYSDDDLSWHQNPLFQTRYRRNLSHEPCDYPFYLLAPDVSSAPGHGWWTGKLKALIQAVGAQTVARNVLCVEYFPYHSERFGHGALRLTSQNYSFNLVRVAIEREAVVVCMRGKRFWFEAVPELISYSRLFHLNSTQNVAVSPRNCPDGFEQLVEIIGHGT
jgi:hypothetical protein